MTFRNIVLITQGLKHLILSCIYAVAYLGLFRIRGKWRERKREEEKKERGWRREENGKGEKEDIFICIC